jgi:uncharacterized membrane protein (GlpM family)
MAADQKKDSGWTGPMRWTARILALIAGGLFLYFAVEFGARVFSDLSLTSPQGLPLLMGLLVALLGALIAWRWEMVGGLMAVGGAFAVITLVCAGSGFDMLYCAFLFTLPLLVAGVLYLSCCWRTQKVESSLGA